MECMYCKANCKKDGRHPGGVQKYRCKGCGKYQQAIYKYKACEAGTDARIVAHVKEGCGTWNIVRLLGIAKGTLTARIKRMALGIKSLAEFPEGGSYEMDELRTFVGSKCSECYVAYAMCRQTGEVVDFVTGQRTKENLQRLTCKVLNLSPRKVYTDGLNVYPSLIPPEIHKAGKWGTLGIERNNLTLRINLKRLARRTICFSRSMEMLEACLKIWFWG
jgi:insertion element IS1 protein InsB